MNIFKNNRFFLYNIFENDPAPNSGTTNPASENGDADPNPKPKTDEIIVEKPYQVFKTKDDLTKFGKKINSKLFEKNTELKNQLKLEKEKNAILIKKIAMFSFSSSKKLAKATDEPKSKNKKDGPVIA